MAIAYFGSGSASTPGTTTATSLTVTTPASIPAGALIIAALSLWSQPTTVTTPTGYTLLTTYGTDQYETLKIYYKIASGGESSIVFPFGNATNAAAGCMVLTGTSTSSPFLAYGGDSVQTSSTSSHTSPSVTNTDATACCVAIFGSTPFAAGRSWTPPSGMTEVWDVGSTNYVTQEGSYVLNAPTGATTKTATLSAGTGVVHWSSWVAFVSPATLPITSDLGATLGHATAQFAGGSKNAATASATLGHMTGQFAAQERNSGSLGATLGHASAQTSGSLTDAGVIGATLGQLQSNMTGVDTNSASVGATLGSVTASFNAGQLDASNIGATLPSMNAQLAAGQTYSGQLGAGLGSMSAEFIGGQDLVAIDCEMQASLPSMSMNGRGRNAAEALEFSSIRTVPIVRDYRATLVGSDDRAVGVPKDDRTVRS